MITSMYFFSWRSALLCYSLELKPGKSNQCYIEELAALDKELVGTTSKCTLKDITQGTTASVVDGSFCYVRAFRFN